MARKVVVLGDSFTREEYLQHLESRVEVVHAGDVSEDEEGKDESYSPRGSRRHEKPRCVKRCRRSPPDRQQSYRGRR